MVATFSDADAHGSSTAHRPGYRQLLAAALTTPPPFDLILVEDLSRLTRQMNETMSMYHRLRLHGVELVGVSDGIASATRGGKIQMAVKGLMNAMYLDDLGEKTHRGLTGSLARGRSPLCL